MYRNFCQAVLPLLFQVFYNFTIFFCVYARKRTFCVFIHKKRGKIVLLRKFLHKKNNKPEGKNTTAQRQKTPSFSPARRNAGMPLSDFSPRGRRPVRRKADDAHGLFLLYFCPSLFSPFPPTARPCPTDLPFSFSSFAFVFSSLTPPAFLPWAHVGGATLSCPLGAKNFPLSTNKTPISKSLLFPVCKLFLSEKIRTDSMTGEKKGDTFFPLSVRDILSAECAAVFAEDARSRSETAAAARQKFLQKPLQKSLLFPSFRV